MSRQAMSRNLLGRSVLWWVLVMAAVEAIPARGEAVGGSQAVPASAPTDVETSRPASDTANDNAANARRFGRGDALLASVTVFVLAVFLGFELITKVPPTLHTPLMSGSNAISGITLVGAAIVAGAKYSTLASLLGMLAVILATINVVGGFLVTHRMLEMFQKKKK